MQTVQEQNCINCGNTFSGKYCNNSGEKVIDHHDKSVLHFLEEGLHFITHFEGKLFTTLKAVFTSPGKLSLDYCAGRRKRYYPPLSFFLLIYVIYLIFPAFSGLLMHLKIYYNMGGPDIRQMIDALAQHHHMSVVDLDAKFHAKGEKISKLLIFILIPMYAMVLRVMSFGKRRYFYDDLILSTELNAILILFGFLLLPLLIYVIRLFSHDFMLSESALMYIMGFSIFLYTLIAVRRFYRYAWWLSFIIALLAMMAQISILLYFYRWLLFDIVIRLIH